MPAVWIDEPPGHRVCTVCSTPLPVSDRTLNEPLGPSSDAVFGRTGRWTALAAGRLRPVPDSAAVPSSALQPGYVLGNRYEILQLLGEGGMGSVYKARDRELDRFVALKVIRPELAQNADALHRFKQELILARQVTHRNVIRIFDLGEADGIKFITMEYVEGQRSQGHPSPDRETRA